MDDPKEAYCPKCDGPVHVTVTPAPGLSGGQANIPDGAEVVCLDFHKECTDDKCPLFGVSGLVMGVRLARADMKPDAWETIAGVCDGCGHTVEMEVLDDTYAYCPDCGTTNKWALIRLGDESGVAIMEKKWKKEGGPPY
jgi:Zn finger protein HypA/HybF involved in hydrogenase expression